MQQIHGECHGPQLILHGGAGPQDPDGERLRKATAALEEIGSASFQELLDGLDPMEAAVRCVEAMEDHDFFNAGKGSALQADGAARLTAAVMDGVPQAFSGIISASFIDHPVRIAKHLQGESSRVLTNPGAELMARTLGMPVVNSFTPARVERWAKKASESCDTVGCVVRGSDGRLVAATSTGGRGFEYPGRVSDSATVAGTYASNFSATSATGVGEQIVDDAMAARLDTRCRDGMSLSQASERCFQEACDLERRYGWIALNPKSWAVAHTTPGMSFVVYGDGGRMASSVTSP